jgi:Nucleotidyltransferase domain
VRIVEQQARVPPDCEAGIDVAGARSLPALRSALLARLAGGLQADQTVQAVALVGSLGRGTGDEWSDIDFMILMDDEQVGRFAERSADRDWARAPLLVDSRQNAPVGCAQINAVHLLDGLPFWVDFCVFPASDTSWPVGHRLIFERRPVRASDQTLDTLTSRAPRQQPVTRTPEHERRVYLALFRWPPST